LAIPPGERERERDAKSESWRDEERAGDEMGDADAAEHGGEGQADSTHETSDEVVRALKS
jgi:hypothetical protein